MNRFLDMCLIVSSDHQLQVGKSRAPGLDENPLVFEPLALDDEARLEEFGPHRIDAVIGSPTQLCKSKVLTRYYSLESITQSLPGFYSKTTNNSGKSTLCW